MGAHEAKLDDYTEAMRLFFPVHPAAPVTIRASAVAVRTVASQFWSGPCTGAAHSDPVL